MKHVKSLLMGAIAFMAVGACYGQERKPGDYILAPEDIILVSVPGYDEFSQKMIITRDGRIALPEVGVVMAAGRTARELETDLQTKIAKVRNNVSVGVLVVETASRKVQVIGAVKNSGKVILGQGWKLLDLIGAAGGLTTRPSLISAKLLRGAQAVDLNLQEAADKPDSEANIKVFPDDLILLTEHEPVQWFVAVKGEVTKKGVFPLAQDTDLPRLLNMSGPTELADLSQAHILRGSEVIPLNLESTALAKPDDKVQGFKLKNGDEVFIPMIKSKFSVTGAVAHSGTFPLPEKKPVTVLDAFLLAGGLPQSDLAKAGILRFDGDKPTLIKVNIEAIYKKADITGNIPLKDRDIIFVPQKGKGGFRLEDLLTPLYLFRYLIP